MGVPKPALGYPSRTAAVAALRLEGLSTADIARRIGIKPTTVTALEISAGALRAKPECSRGIELPSDVLTELRPHATRRHIDPYELAREIICRVVDEDLIDAVMDDNQEAAR